MFTIAMKGKLPHNIFFDSKERFQHFFMKGIYSSHEELSHKLGIVIHSLCSEFVVICLCYEFIFLPLRNVSFGVDHLLNMIYRYNLAYHLVFILPLFLDKPLILETGYAIHAYVNLVWTRSQRPESILYPQTSPEDVLPKPMIRLYQNSKP